jgi:hypothetical protein
MTSKIITIVGITGNQVSPTDNWTMFASQRDNVLTMN